VNTGDLTSSFPFSSFYSPDQGQGPWAEWVEKHAGVRKEERWQGTSWEGVEGLPDSAQCTHEIRDPKSKARQHSGPDRFPSKVWTS
jgi:hypothetical protein